MVFLRIEAGDVPDNQVVFIDSMRFAKAFPRFRVRGEDGRIEPVRNEGDFIGTIAALNVKRRRSPGTG